MNDGASSKVNPVSGRASAQSVAGVDRDRGDGLVAVAGHGVPVAVQPVAAGAVVPGGRGGRSAGPMRSAR